MFGKTKEENKQLVNKIASLELRSAKLKAEAMRAQEDLKAERESAKDKAVAQRATERRLKEENSILQDRLSALQDLHEDYLEKETLAISLDDREKIIAAREESVENFEKLIKGAKKEAKEEAEVKYKTGYSDGLADGLRKIHEITAEDRKQAMQVAALAASSHTPEAATVVAESIRNNMMALPEGKKAKK